MIGHAVEKTGKDRVFQRAQSALLGVFDGLDAEDRCDIDSGLFYFRQYAAELKHFGVDLKPVNQTL